MRSVSVVIPTHNRKNLLRRALFSVFSQSLQPDEIIVIDDGSTDGTEAMVVAEFPAVEFVRQGHSGVSSARNLGIKLSQSEWVAFLDSDDEWMPDKLSWQAKMLVLNSESNICHCDEVWLRNGIRVNPKAKHRKRGGSIYQYCLPLCAISPSAVVIHRSIFERVGGFDETLPVCEDYEMWLRICAGHLVEYVDRPLVIKHGGHDDQLSRAYPAMDFYRIAALRKVLNTDALTVQDRLHTLKALLAKLEIYANGVLKRNRHSELRDLRQLALRYEAEYQSLQQNDQHQPCSSAPG